MLSSWTSWFNKTTLFYYRSSLFLARKLIELVYFFSSSNYSRIDVDDANPASSSSTRRRRPAWSEGPCPGLGSARLVPGGATYRGRSLVRSQPVVDPNLLWWRSGGPVTVRRLEDPAEVVRHHVSEEDEHVHRYMVTWLRWMPGSPIPGRFFRDLTGAMILWWFLLFGCPPPAPILVIR